MDVASSSSSSSALVRFQFAAASVAALGRRVGRGRTPETVGGGESSSRLWASSGPDIQTAAAAAVLALSARRVRNCSLHRRSFLAALCVDLFLETWTTF